MIRALVAILAWPVLFGAALAATGWGFAIGMPMVVFNVTYLSLAAVLLCLERLTPHEPAWLEPDGQLGPDLAHTLVNKGTVQILLAVGTVMGIAQLAGAEPGPWWPADWPMALQIALGLVLIEFGLYWAHRLEHEWPLLWRFHAIHHSVTRLWVVNTGRFHVVDTALSILMAQPILILVGAPQAIVMWVSAITAFIGLMTHCNIDMRCGPLSLVFNTPNLHRWHHSRVLEEGNKNYGENLMLWDHVFGTWYNPPRRPPRDIGIDEPMPRDFFGQLAFPWRRAPLRPPLDTAE